MTRRWWGNDLSTQWELEERGHMYYSAPDERTAKAMPKFSDYKSESQFLKAQELVEACQKASRNPLTYRRELTIKEVKPHKFEAREGQPEQEKLICFFEGWPEDGRGLVLNSGNTSVLSELCGDDTDQAPGKKVEFYLDVEPFAHCGYGMRLRPVGSQAEDDIPF